MPIKKNNTRIEAIIRTRTKHDHNKLYNRCGNNKANRLSVAPQQTSSQAITKYTMNALPSMHLS